jgi:hypothetical protein
MAFHRDEFIQNEVMSGNLTIDEANSVLKAAGQPTINPLLGKLATQKWLSPVLAGVGATAALPLAPVTLGGSSVFGGFGGYGLGEMLKTEAGNLSGLSPSTPQGQRDQLGNSVQNAAGAGLIAGTGADVLMAGNAALHPIKTLSNVRTNIWNKQGPIPYQTADESLMGAAQRAKLSTVQDATKTKAEDLMVQWFPQEGTGTIPKQSAFEKLREWEKLNKTWSNSSPDPLQQMSTQNVSSGARALLRGNDWRIGALNKSLQLLEGLAPYKKWIVGAGIGLPLIRSAIYGLINSAGSNNSQ